MASKVAFRYVGGGEHYNGIPGRDLTQEEFDALGERDQETVRAASIYEAVAAKKADPPADPPADAEGKGKGK